MSTETKAKHTPGPWRFSGRLILANEKPRSDGGTYADVVAMFGEHWRKDEEHFANASLIAAAPALLAAAEAALTAFSGGFWCEHEGKEPDAKCKHCAYTQLEAAIRAVKGE